MRTVFTFLFVVGVAMLAAGAATPGLFVVSLLGMVVLAGTATVALAVMQHPGPPHLHH